MISRRSFLSSCVLAASGGIAFAKDRTMEEWMDDWMRPRKLNGTLHVSRFVEAMYYLTKAIGWSPGPAVEGLAAVEVPIGFVTDFASIPQIFWSVLPTDGEYTYPAVIHDYLYWIQDRPRKDCDRLFRLAMQDLNLNEATIETIYLAVRAGGNGAWESNMQAKANGDKRILKVFPTDPTTRWADWKKRPDVF